MAAVTDIRNFHAHVYFDDATRDVAEALREAIARVFPVSCGVVYARAVGPHPKGMFQVTIAPDEFAAIVPWLMLNRAGLSVLVHPTTDDAIADHATNPMWMGEVLAMDLDFVRSEIEKRNEEKTK